MFLLFTNTFLPTKVNLTNQGQQEQRNKND